ncbi:MAG: TM0106 family RecB-like putative nuclease [Dehalococcoidia bacterium]|nr:TM0106 family RecB-like putative nuclease [Dehalococcoidia bacterium]
MRQKANAVQFSPSDLSVFLESEFASWMDRWYLERNRRSSGQLRTDSKPFHLFTTSQATPDQPDEEARLFQGKGMAHETAFLARLRAEGNQVTEISGTESALKATEAAMEDQAAFIYQGHLEHDPFAGWADFLARQPGKSRFGAYSYEPWDTKLARSSRPDFLVQLCAYADMLDHMQGDRPNAVHVLLGTNERKTFRTASFRYYVAELTAAFLAFQASFDAQRPPQPGLSKSFGRWTGYAESILKESNHLSLVATMTRGQIRHLESVGVATLSALAASTLPGVSGIERGTFERLRSQAHLQVESKGKTVPLYRVRPHEGERTKLGLALLPPASAGDVFFDMEGYPLADDGLEYLFGAVTHENGVAIFNDWWAHDNAEEKQAFEQFIDWATDRWKRHPDMHIYHYASYEPAAMRKLMGKHATHEDEVDELLRHQVFVDLYTVVRQGLVIGTPGYSLKDIECLYGTQRQGSIKNASASVVAYASWLESGEGKRPTDSPVLEDIRRYNEVDCQSLTGLAEWLRDEQRRSGIQFAGAAPAGTDDQKTSDAVPEPPARLLAQQLLKQSEAFPSGDPERRRVQQLVAYLLEFHRREEKPMWWRMFDRSAMEDQELVDDLDCLGNMRRTAAPRRQDKKSWAYEYTFDPSQDTKLHVESPCYFARDLESKTEIVSMDRANGRLEIKLGPTKPTPPELLSLIPDEHVPSTVISNAILRYGEKWVAGGTASQAVDDVLFRHPPRIRGLASGDLITDGKELLPQVISLVQRLDSSTLCIQGPPGCGKTFTMAAAIVALLRDGKRVGVTANGHKTVMNVFEAVFQAEPNGVTGVPVLKVGGDTSETLIQNRSVKHVESAGALAAMGSGPVLIGGTAWLFSRPELVGQLDYLFIDEAGQFALANIVGVGPSARNVVLVGDQMQLAQPIQGTHPGDSGKSGLEYLLDGKATVPPDLGVLLNTTWRMHPTICTFISDAIYEGRLEAHPRTERQRVAIGTGRNSMVPTETGILFKPVVHEGNAQESDEEVDAVEAIVRELLERKVQDAGARSLRPLTLDDILIVAPYNMQVRRIAERLGLQAHVGSVDKFQGLEAHVVIVSMCASSLDEAPRGAEFLLSPNRLNVAVSRAKSLAIVVASPALLASRCETVNQMELVNLLCWLKNYAGSSAGVTR